MQMLAGVGVLVWAAMGKWAVGSTWRVKPIFQEEDVPGTGAQQELSIASLGTENSLAVLETSVCVMPRRLSYCHTAEVTFA
jgi:hypothetical protein